MMDTATTTFPASSDRSGRPDRPVYVIDGARTPFLKARGAPGPFSPVDLTVQCGRPLLVRQPFAPTAFDQVILGCVNVVADEMNPARIAAIRLGAGDETPAFTAQINCGSGMLSVDLAVRAIRHGDADLILAGGADALSHSPLVVRRKAVEWFSRWTRARTPSEVARLVTAMETDFFKPVVGLERGLTDPTVELNMGQTAEVLAHLFRIAREDADRYAVDSHTRLARAQKAGWLEGEVEPAVADDGRVFERDDGVRPDTSLEVLAELDPVFEKPWGQVTAGNSSQVTDGASWLILASDRAVDEHGLEPRARIVDSAWRALDPSIMGLGPVLSATAILQRRQATLDTVDLWEINEAFAAQVLACLAAWRDETFCREVLGEPAALGAVPRDRLNVDGGAIGLGHPVGASGNRLVLHLVNALHRRGLTRGVATECIGGGQGGAMLVETV